MRAGPRLGREGGLDLVRGHRFSRGAVSGAGGTGSLSLGGYPLVRVDRTAAEGLPHLRLRGVYHAEAVGLLQVHRSPLLVCGRRFSTSGLRSWVSRRRLANLRETSLVVGNPARVAVPKLPCFVFVTTILPPTHPGYSVSGPPPSRPLRGCGGGEGAWSRMGRSSAKGMGAHRRGGFRGVRGGFVEAAGSTGLEGDSDRGEGCGSPKSPSRREFG